MTPSLTLKVDTTPFFDTLKSKTETNPESQSFYTDKSDVDTINVTFISSEDSEATSGFAVPIIRATVSTVGKSIVHKTAHLSSLNPIYSFEIPYEQLQNTSVKISSLVLQEREGECNLLITRTQTFPGRFIGAHVARSEMISPIQYLPKDYFTLNADVLKVDLNPSFRTLGEQESLAITTLCPEHKGREGIEDSILELVEAMQKKDKTFKEIKEVFLIERRLKYNFKNLPKLPKKPALSPAVHDVIKISETQIPEKRFFQVISSRKGAIPFDEFEVLPGSQRYTTKEEIGVRLQKLTEFCDGSLFLTSKVPVEKAVSAKDAEMKEARSKIDLIFQAHEILKKEKENDQNLKGEKKSEKQTRPLTDLENSPRKRALIDDSTKDKITEENSFYNSAFLSDL